MDEKKNYYIKIEKKRPFKWKQNVGVTIDDITFSDGEREIDFGTWINEYY